MDKILIRYIYFEDLFEVTEITVLHIHRNHLTITNVVVIKTGKSSTVVITKTAKHFDKLGRGCPLKYQNELVLFLKNIITQELVIFLTKTPQSSVFEVKHLYY